jgi:cysteine-rich repeat protein
VFVGGALFFARGPLSHGLGLGLLCGNGKLEGNEECDDGNTAADDACLPTCKIAVCGDGVKRAHAEECDDGNQVDGDGCSSGCLTCETSATSFSSSDNGHCYWLEPEAKSYEDALATCVGKRGYLATYGTDVEWREITDHLLAPRASTGAWIGLRQEERNGVRDFGWVSGERTLAAHWAVHEPRRTAGFDCTAQSGAGTWTAAYCADKREFVCERPRWLRFARDTRTYRRFVDAKPWAEAAATCNDLGGRLLTFRNGADQERLTRRFPGPIWLGVRLDEKTGDFAWADGEPLGYRDFAPGEPNLLKFQHCVAVDIDGRWYNRECSDRNRYVCEIP